MGCRFALANPSAQVLRVLALLGLSEEFATDDA
jgi:anti-anti-sigma regulatory factor